MVKNPEKLRAFEVERIKAEAVDIEKNFRILDALYEEVRALGKFPPKIRLKGSKRRSGWPGPSKESKKPGSGNTRASENSSPSGTSNITMNKMGGT